MDFRTYFTRLPVAERDAFAARAGTSRGYCNQVAYAGKQIELGMADVFVACSGGLLSLDELPLTDRALQQRSIREGRGCLEIVAQSQGAAHG